jgi:hypothetical protein
VEQTTNHQRWGTTSLNYSIFTKSFNVRHRSDLFGMQLSIKLINNLGPISIFVNGLLKESGLGLSPKRLLIDGGSVNISQLRLEGGLYVYSLV